MELVQRLRFDIVFCSIGLPGLNWIEFSEDVRSRIGAFVLLTEAFDFDLSRGMLSGESNVLTRPFSDDDLDRLLGVIETKLSTPEGGRRLQIIRHEKRAISL
jgi:CheY-like chemotaxis protein